MNLNKDFLQNLYDAFNARQIETILSMMREDVRWANGMAGGFIDGRDNVRQYWLKQFELIDPQLEPVQFEMDEAGRNIVTVRQIVKDLEDNLLLDKMVKQIFTFEDGSIKVFELEESETLAETEDFKTIAADFKSQSPAG